MPGDEHHEFVVTVPAGTTKAAPLTTLTRLPVRRVVQISWTIPPGASGTTGFRITMGGVQVIPANFGAWIVRDGTDGSSALARLPDSGSWDVTAYNTGKVAHSVYITFYVDIIQRTPAPIMPLGLDALQFGLGAPPAHHQARR